jgi:hypothetical protein
MRSLWLGIVDGGGGPVRANNLERNMVLRHVTKARQARQGEVASGGDNKANNPIAAWKPSLHTRQQLRDHRDMLRGVTSAIKQSCGHTFTAEVTWHVRNDNLGVVWRSDARHRLHWHIHLSTCNLHTEEAIL